MHIIRIPRIENAYITDVDEDCCSELRLQSLQSALLLLLQIKRNAEGMQVLTGDWHNETGQINNNQSMIQRLDDLSQGVKHKDQSGNQARCETFSCVVWFHVTFTHNCSRASSKAASMLACVSLTWS